MNLDSLVQQRADLWRGGVLRSPVESGVPSGFPALDQVLAGGGWPRRAVIEILSNSQGREALSLVMPALRHLSQMGRWIAWVAPPYVPYAPALAGRGLVLSRLLVIDPEDESLALWALEQALRSGACGGVLAWPGKIGMARLRRLQLAAEAGDALAFLFRPGQVARQASPAVLRLQVRSLEGGIEVDILKRRGGWAVGPMRLAIPAA